ncbi:MAG: bifunctional folylpolyglutamate synthase/dihydrofolate synthase [Gammaproteobacteria bacterium]|nr:bifunctional folylpolyglutamate synthase/dihydrofolate synthase [Gammaproteobacteria bacterium]
MSKNLKTHLESISENSLPAGSGVTRTSTVATRLELLPFNVPVITVAGTNGKGSCVAFLEAILLAESYRVGAYVSPHLLSYNERIRIDGENIDDASLCVALSAIMSARADVELSYFDFTTLAAFVIFKQLDLDVVILEVGIGGRLDPVNAVDPSISVITTIALDHMDRLGNDRESIGFEKAGIMRLGVPVVCGDAYPPASVVNMAHKLGAPLYCFNKSFGLQQLQDRWHWSCGDKELATVLHPCYPVSLSRYPESHSCYSAPHLRHSAPHSRHPALDAGSRDICSVQCIKHTLDSVVKPRNDGLVEVKHLPLPKLPLQNAATALMVIELLQDALPVSRRAIDVGIAKAFLPGRMQCISVAPEVILDVAHNAEASAYLAQQLSGRSKGRVLAVCAMLQDKDILATLKPMLSVVDSWYVASLDCERGANAHVLQHDLEDLGINSCYTADTVSAALAEAVAASFIDDCIIVFGSFYTVAEILKWRNERGSKN